MGHFSATILRISNPYGILLPSDRKQGLIGVVLNRIKEGQAIKVFGDPQNIRDYIHLDDLCSAFLNCLKAQTEGIYNIGSGVGNSVTDVFSIIESAIDMKLPREYISNEQTKKLRPWVILNVHKAERDFGWKPHVTFESALKTLCHQYLL
jgi:UDP-glucose 4-epimerase